MTVFLGLVAFLAVSLVGWAIAENKEKVFGYHNNPEEEEMLQHTIDMQRQNDYKEMNISDVIRTISTKGFKA